MNNYYDKYYDNYYKKYIKYKSKYIYLQQLSLNKQNLNNVKQEGGRYDCDPKKPFKDLCFEKQDGKYKNKDGCINDCELNYINYHLIKTGIKGETIKFYLFIKDIIKNKKIDVYIKGGNVIGLKVLKMIRDKYKNDDKKFKEVFEKFLELELIKDWDFSGYTKEIITDEYRDQLDKIAEEYKLVPRAKTFILYQTKRPLLTDDKPMFEIAILDSDRFTKLEIPLTTMKVKVNEFNLKYIFMFCKSFMLNKNYNKPKSKEDDKPKSKEDDKTKTDKTEEKPKSKEELYKEYLADFDFDILKRMIDKIQIIIYPHKNGLYDVNKSNFDKGILSDELVNFIQKYDDFDKNLPQFLIIHIEDPYRILYRLPEKNMKKNDKIKKFIEDYIDKKRQDWLFDSKFIDKSIKLFMGDLGKHIATSYITEFKKTQSIQKALEKALVILDGISFNRVQTDFNMLTDYGKNLLSLLFSDLIKQIDEINLISLTNTTKTIEFIKFLGGKLN
jgi:hypothetical protein